MESLTKTQTEIKNRTPLILAMGRSGVGKSTILNKITGDSTKFLAGQGAESLTDDFIFKRAYWRGDSNDNQILVCDSIGYEDNRSIDPLFATKTQRFLLELNHGIDVLLVLVNSQLSFRENYMPTINLTLDLLGKKIISKMILVFTQTNMLQHSEREKCLKEFSFEKIKNSINARGHCIKQSQIIIYENTPENTECLITKIKDMCLGTDPLIPETSILIKENLHKNFCADNKHGVQDACLYYVSRNHTGIKRYLTKLDEKYEDILADSFSILNNMENLEYFENEEFQISQSLNNISISDQISQNNKPENSNQEINLSEKITENILLQKDNFMSDSQSNSQIQSGQINEIKVDVAPSDPPMNSQKKSDKKNILIENASQNVENYQIYKDPYSTSAKGLLAVGKAGIEIGAKNGVKIAEKVAEKTTFSVMGKKVPLIGVFVGLGFGIYRLINREPLIKAAGEVASGIASCFPGVGTGISIGIDATLLSHDIYKLKK